MYNLQPQLLDTLAYSPLTSEKETTSGIKLEAVYVNPQQIGSNIAQGSSEAGSLKVWIWMIGRSYSARVSSHSAAQLTSALLC